MSSKSGFMSNLNKSTKITMFSCLGFILLTGVILLFFIIFPITPSEKVMASIGRENVVNNGSGGSPQSITPAVITTVSGESKDTVTSTTTTGTTTTRTVNIRITTGSGFLWNGRIPTGGFSGDNSYPTVVVDPIVPTPDPGAPIYPQGTTPPADAGTTPPAATTPNPDPNGGTVTPPSDTPATPEPPVDTPPETPVTPPETPVSPPPADTPEPPPADTPAPPPADTGGSSEAPAE